MSGFLMGPLRVATLLLCGVTAFLSLTIAGEKSSPGTMPKITIVQTAMR